MTQQCPDLDKEAFEIWEKDKSPKRGAAKLGIPKGTFKNRVERHRKRIACDAQAPDGFKVKGTSTLFNARGELVAQWVKTAAFDVNG